MANKGTNTGTGGINIDDKQYSMDVGLPNSEGGAQGQWSAGDVAVDDADFKKDITKPTKETFARYMSKTTLGQAGSSTHRNYYAVGTGEGTVVRDLKLTDELGYPSKIQETENEEKFSSINIGVPIVEAEILKKGLGPRQVDDGNKLLLNAAVPAAPGGPYIKNAKELNPPIRAYVSSAIKKNRFNSDKKYFDNYLNTGVRPNDNVPPVIVSQFLKSGVSPSEQEQPVKMYDFNRLAHVGTILQLAATGEAAVVGGSSTIDPNDFGVAISTLAPGVGQLGAGVPLPSEYLDVKDILNRLTENPISDAQLTEFTNQFEGVINSSFEKFSGFSSLGMTALVLALSIVVIAAIEAAAALFPLDPNSQSVAAGSSILFAGEQSEFGKSTRLGMGTYYGGKTAGYPEDLVSTLANLGSGGAMQFFGILPTKINFLTATSIGVKTTFGLGSNFEPRTTAQNSGYLVTICRAIIRSVTRFFVEFVELGKLLESGNIGDAFGKSLEIISTIKNSRFIRSINVFAQIGDRFDPISETLGDVTLNIDSTRKISMLDGISTSNAASAAYGRSRLYPDRKNLLKLAWTADRAPDTYILPPYIKKFSVELQGPIYDKRSSSSRARYEEIDITRSRISPDAIAEIESKLEAEYLPFYIQDLRTNEFVAFHAFLTTLADDYSANYESTDGIGRMDPVKIFKNTTRRVSVGFVLAALDGEDFQGMWEKINKLTTLVYPQYTKGKKIEIDGNFSFEKPFTQTIAASPMVRLRVGNLFTSNYSKFNIAGIFGLFDDTARLVGKNFIEEGEETSFEQEAKPEEKKEELNTIFVGSEHLLTSDTYKVVLEEGGKYLPDSYTNATIFAPYAIAGEVLQVKDGKVNVILKEANPEDYPSEFWVRINEGKAVLKKNRDALISNAASEMAALGLSGTETAAEQAARAVELFDKSIGLGATSYSFTVDKLIQASNKTITKAKFSTPSWKATEEMLTAKSEAQKAQDAAAPAAAAASAAASNAASNVTSNLPSPPASVPAVSDPATEVTAEAVPGSQYDRRTYIDEVKTFLDEKNNSIVRSFKSAGGKGLAGFIESLGFDWNSGTWDVEPGRWAPKMCRITISFAPIHDISPGLDAYGYNRAPIYPLGRVGKRKVGA